MHATQQMRTRIAVAVSALFVGCAAGEAFGAAFALQENSGSALGNAFAGGAAAAEDVSTLWSNPAGLSRLAGPQVATAVHLVSPSFKFRDDGSQAAAFQRLGGTGGDAGDLAVIPNLYAAMPINAQLAVGLGVNAPFGLVTEYDDWLGRFQGIKSDIKTINVNPSMSWRVNNTFAIGVGVNWQRVDAELTSKVNYSAALAQAAGQAAAGGLISPSLVPTIVSLTPGLESKATVEGDDSAWGWNIGFLWDATPQTRVGGHYRSSIKYNVSANVNFCHPSQPAAVGPCGPLLPALPAQIAPVVGLLANGVNNALANGGVKADIELPDVANLSVFHRLNDRWDLMADVQFTRWSTFKDLRFVRTTGALLSNTPENFDDAWRVSVGATYHWTDARSFRGGISWDETPVNFTDRTPRLPDEERVWLAIGAQYRYSRNLKIDAGFVYIPIKSPDIAQNAGSTAANGLIRGHYDANVTVLSAQLTYSF
jgi:long-chain fatty acid transport protein